MTMNAAFLSSFQGVDLVRSRKWTRVHAEADVQQHLFASWQVGSAVVYVQFVFRFMCQNKMALYISPSCEICVVSLNITLCITSLKKYGQQFLFS